MQDLLQPPLLGRQFFAPQARLGKMILRQLEQRLLGVAVAQATGTIASGQVLDLVLVGEQLVQVEHRTPAGVLGIFDRCRVGLDRHHLLADPLGRFE